MSMDSLEPLDRLDRYWDELVTGEPGEPADLDGGLVATVRRLHSLDDVPSPEPQFADRLLHELTGRIEAPTPQNADGAVTGAAKPEGLRRQRPGIRRSRSALRAAVIVVAILGIGASLLASPQVRAQVSRLACYVPDMGIRACDAPGLVALAPVSVSRGAATLTVTDLLSSGGVTTVRLEITGLPEPAGSAALGAPIAVTSGSGPPASPPPQPVPVRLTLRDASGKEYPLALRAFPSGANSSRFSAGPGSPRIFGIERDFAALEPGVRAVDLDLDAASPVGSWSVSVPVVPVQQAGLPAARAGSAAVTHHGITVRIESAAADHQRTAVHLTAQAKAPAFAVRDIGGDHWLGQQLVLRDDRGREYKEIPPVGLSFLGPNCSVLHCNASDVVFPPLAPDARSATLVVPFVAVAETAGSATVQIPIAGRRPGDVIPLQTDLALGPYKLRVTGAKLLNTGGHLLVVLQLDLGNWQNGRRLLGPELVQAEGGDPSSFGHSSGSFDRYTEESALVPPGVTDEVNITLVNAVVAVQGPWNLTVPLPAGR